MGVHLRVRYDETRPEVWKVPFFGTIVPSRTVRAPGAGYVVPPAHAAWVRAKLSRHGFETEVLAAPRAGAAVEVWRARETTFDSRPYEARTAVHLLEPEASESLVSWGFFSAVFEQKEYMESYVTEEAAEEMLRADPALRGEFERALAADPELAKDPRRRLDFFYRRHPAWDERKDEYPIVRVGTAP